MAGEVRELGEYVTPVQGFQRPGGEGLASVSVIDGGTCDEFGGDGIKDLFEVAGRAAGDHRRLRSADREDVDEKPAV
ncbi:hypothetical protein AB0D38_05520 [Streptomyces sp. NPDC048279]|uniref:hypothetical protein n=1 Tax=Streptomyces sp. NPDC048279 TaxID=3154714 RepID=UPI00341FEB01